MRIGTTKLQALLAVAAILGSATVVIVRSELAKGWSAYERGDHALAVKQIRPYAKHQSSQNNCPGAQTPGL